jgi:hypothetical protein
LPVKIAISKNATDLSYMGEKVYVYKYQIQVGKTTIGEYYLYKYDSIVYILDGFFAKLNHTKDQVFFELPVKNFIRIKLNGILEDAEFILERYLSMNNLDLYYYAVKDKSKSIKKIKLTKIVFDNKLQVAEWQIQSANGGKCQCTKKGLVVRLK